MLIEVVNMFLLMIIGVDVWCKILVICLLGIVGFSGMIMLFVLRIVSMVVM